LLVRLLLFMTLVLLLFSLFLFKPLHVLLHVLIKDLPLGRFNRELRALWRVSLDSPLFEDMIEGLASSLLVVKGIS